MSVLFDLPSPAGIYLIPVLNHIWIWQGVLFLHHGPFQGGVFRFLLEMPLNYPQEPPLVRFTTPICHPRVDPLTGAFDMTGIVPFWEPKKVMIWHILEGIKKGLVWIDSGISKNLEAAELYVTSLTRM